MCCIRKILLFVVFEISAMMLSVLVVFLIGFLSAIMAGGFYDRSHAVPDPVLRGDDLGGGLVMVAAAISSLLFSIPCVIFIHFKLFKFFFRRDK